MEAVFVSVTVLLSFPFLFPEESTYWVRLARKKLEEQQHAWAVMDEEEEALREINQAWRAAVDDFFRELPQAKSLDERTVLVNQTLQLGRRYLYHLPPETFPREYQTVERFCQQLQRIAELAVAAEQPRARCGNLTPVYPHLG